MRTIAWAFLLSFFSTQAQTVSDSVTMLDEVIVFGLSLDEYAAGSSIQSIAISNAASLQDLGNNSTLFFKNYGNGGLSTISLRGTSANHTNVLWNGIPVNSPTLGQTDYSVFPAFLIDNVSVLKGSASALFGSGSIGGTIIQDNSKLQKDSLLSLYSAVGSFGQLNGGVKSQYSLAPKFRAETRLFYGKLENDFKYELRGVEVSQPNAAVSRLGFSQRVKYKKEDHSLFAEVAYSENDREVQPTKVSTSRNHLFTQNLRGVLSQEMYRGNAAFFTSLGYAGETTVYNASSETNAHTFSSQFAVDLPLKYWLSTRIGFNTIHARAKSEGYPETQQVSQMHFYSSFSMSPIENLRLSINLREAFHKNNAVFAPSFGIENTVRSFTFRSQASKGYRVPTFNDRFWIPGGNPDLEPEESRNFELGIDFQKSNFQLSVTGFLSDVSHWIQWIPVDGIFTPTNLREVTTRGIEANSTFHFSINSMNIKLDSDYEFTLSSDGSSEERNQLPYVAKHSGFSSLNFSKNMIELMLRANYTGLRYTTLTNSKQSEIDPFLLCDVIFGIHNPFKIWNTTLNISANNVFDVEYENVKNTAMPGRNFLIEITTKF